MHGPPFSFFQIRKSSEITSKIPFPRKNYTEVSDVSNRVVVNVGAGEGTLPDRREFVFSSRHVRLSISTISKE